MFEYGLMLIKGEGGQRGLLMDGRTLSALRRWEELMRSGCWSTPSRKVYTATGHRGQS